MGDGGQEATRLDCGTFPFGLRLVRFGTEDSFPIIAMWSRGALSLFNMCHFESVNIIIDSVFWPM